MDDPEGLLAGPRGRRLCLELVRAMARVCGTPACLEYLRADFSAAYDLDPGRGTSRVMAVAWGEDRQEVAPSFAADDVARLLAVVPLDRVDGRDLLAALVAAVDSARYWQPPDGEDALCATAPVRGALARVAATVTSSGAAAWWSTPLDRVSQSRVWFDDPASPTYVTAATAEQSLARWRVDVEQEEVRDQRQRPSDPRAPWSGIWWSTPPSDLPRITRDLGVQGPVGLWAVEDGFGWDHATVRPVAVPGDARVYEVDGPQTWAQLCRRFPLEVTASRRHDWYRATGAAGRWVIPDWSQAAEHFDAVHLTVDGYLKTAGRAVGVTADTSSVLAGWNPDETYWLTDPGPATGAQRLWARTDDTWAENQR